MSETKTRAHKGTGDKFCASIDQQIDDSFPASDPPSYNAGSRVGQPHRAKEKDRKPGKTEK